MKIPNYVHEKVEKIKEERKEKMEKKVINIVVLGLILNFVILAAFTFATSKQYSDLKNGVEARIQAKYKTKIEKLELKIAEFEVKKFGTGEENEK